MRKIDKPEIRVREVVIDCIANMTDIVLKSLIEIALDSLEEAENDYDERKAINTLFEIVRNTQISADVNRKVLKSIYSDRMVNKSNAARKYYDQLLIGAPSGRCPQCGVRVATTLDHNLPKSKYALLATSPLNLIPSCSDCNKGKLVDFPTTAEQETIHPYYDNIENEQWLVCQVLSVNPLLIQFYSRPGCHLNATLRTRIINHFNSFHLNRLYTTHAIEEFENSKGYFTKLFEVGGKDNLESHIQESYQSRKAININSWQCAFYLGLLNSADFCNGNFL